MNLKISDICPICNQAITTQIKKGHVFPKALSCFLMKRNNNNKLLQISNGNECNTKGSGIKSGFFWCSNCEDRFSKIDNKFMRFFHNIKTENITYGEGNYGALDISFDYSDIDLFVASVLLRYHIAEYNNIRLDDLSHFTDFVLKGVNNIISSIMFLHPYDFKIQTMSTNIPFRIKDGISEYNLHLPKGLRIVTKTSRCQFNEIKTLDNKCRMLNTLFVFSQLTTSNTSIASNWIINHNNIN
jgi:hypothetical protein